MTQRASFMSGYPYRTLATGQSVSQPASLTMMTRTMTQMTMVMTVIKITITTTKSMITGKT